MIYRCDLKSQYLMYKEEIDEAIRSVMDSGRYTLGENVASFEREFSKYIGMDYGVGVNSGTDALILALKAVGIGEGDEVITTPFTAIPTYAAIKETGANPVFVDIEPDTFLMDLHEVKHLVNEKTKAVIPVHLFGNVVDIEKLRSTIRKDITIIEDCAQSHGAAINGKRAGSIGDLSAFSFYPTKNLGAYGDGGMILTNSSELQSKLKKMRMYGMVNKDEFDSCGVNSRLDELQASILRAKLKFLDKMNEIRHQKVSAYSLKLNGLLTPQAVGEGVTSVWHLYCCLCKEDVRDNLVEYLDKRGIQTNIYYKMPLNEQRGYLDTFGQSSELKVAKRVSNSIIALPFYPEIQDEIMDRVVNEIVGFFNKGAS